MDWQFITAFKEQKFPDAFCFSVVVIYQLRFCLFQNIRFIYFFFLPVVNACKRLALWLAYSSYNVCLLN